MTHQTLRLGNWHCDLLLALILFSCLALTASAARAQNGCNSYEDFLDQIYPKNPETEYHSPECEAYEVLIISSSNFREFAFGFHNSVSQDDYPVHLFRAISQYDRDNLASALLNIDVSVSNIAEVFTKIDDRGRAKTYSYLALRLRNEILSQVVSDVDFLAALNGIVVPSSLSKLDHDKFDTSTVIACLVSLDALRISFERLLTSKAFKTCLIHERGDKEKAGD